MNFCVHALRVWVARNGFADHAEKDRHVDELRRRNWSKLQPTACSRPRIGDSSGVSRMLRGVRLGVGFALKPK